LGPSLAFAQAQVAANALPTGGQVVAGQVHINTAPATPATRTTLNVVQTSQRAVVNWNSFNIGANARVEIIQPNAQAVIHNRVVSASPTQIDGMLKSNGQVVISNAKGVTFGTSAQIDVGAIVATTMDINDKDFMDGKNTYKGDGTGAVVNYGKIQTRDPKGYVALLAPEVRNEGYILARGGAANTVAMASGSQITLDFRGDQLMNVKVDASAFKSLIENKRLVQVEGGLVVIAANSAAQLMGSVIKNSGRISTSSMVRHGGIVEILADTVQNLGSIVANAMGTAGNGGQISLKGNTIALADSSKIKANAKEQGNGGQIVVLSNKKTQVSGILEAMGGKTRGNGGFIDTSSKEVLEISSQTKVDTSARNILGKAGTWLLDPMDLLITSSFAQVISDALQNNNVTVQVQGNVCSGGSCTQNGSGNLTIDQGVTITKTGSARTVLTFLADGTFFNYGTINQAAGSILDVVIHAQDVNLAQNSSIEVNKVTITAVNSVTGYGSIIGAGSNPLVNILANVFNFHGVISANGLIGNQGQTQNPGSIRITAQDIILSSIARLEANGSINGGTITLSTNDTGHIIIEGVIQTNGGNGRGGEITISQADDIQINNAIIQSNANNGGSIQIITNSGDLILQNALIQTNGSNGRGGSIGISATNNTLISDSNIEAKGFNQGGRILIGNDADNGTLPFSIYTDINSNTDVSTDQLGLFNPDFIGGFIETSGHTLNLLGTINAGRGGMWLLDPTNVTISSAVSSGGDLTSAQGQATTSNFNTTQIQTAINNGTSVTIIASGTITQTTALVFNVTGAGLTPTLTLNNTSGSKQNITLIAMTDNSSGAGSGVSLQAMSSGGGIIVNGALTLKGSVTLDNTFGGTAGAGGTPTSGFITRSNAPALASALRGVDVGAAINTIGGITLKGASIAGYYSVDVSAALTSAIGDINITGSGTTFSVYSGSAGIITAKAGSVTITGTATTGQAVQLTGAIVANAGITINGTATTASTITTVNALTLGYGYVVGDTVNPKIISSAAGASGSLLGVLSGTTLPTISSAGLTGGSIVGFYPATAIALQSSSATTATYLIGYANGVHTKMVQVVLTSSGGLVYATETLAKYSFTQLAAGTANNVLGGSTNLLQLWSGSAAGGLGTVYPQTLATTATGTGYAAANLSLGGSGYTANARTGNITITANNDAAGGNNGIAQSGAITAATGSNISFISNNKINQTGAIALVANTGSTAANIVYDTTSGNKAGNITLGDISIAAGTNNAPINIIAKSSGSAIASNIIGTAALPLPGSITLDNTFGGTAGVGGTPSSGFINTTTANLATLATTSHGITVSASAALNATGNILINGVSNGGMGVYYESAIKSSAGDVTFNAATTNYYGVYTSNASLITANNITINATSTLDHTGNLVQAGALTINATSVGGDILISSLSKVAGGRTGIYQSGAIIGANGSDMTFITNNKIDINGAITVAANTSGTAANITFDTTRGT
jgi:filamentous hemagglutinin family protein